MDLVAGNAYHGCILSHSPILLLLFDFFVVSQYRDISVCVAPRKGSQKQAKYFSAITCYMLRAVTVSSSGSENIVPVLKLIAVSHAVILAGVSRGGTVQQKWVEISRSINFLGKV